MLSLINWRLKITINDGRALTGQMLAFDRHMNLVLADCEEFRRVRAKKKPGEESAPEQEMKRTLGLVILRGETVVSISVEGPPPVVDEDKKTAVRHSAFAPVHLTYFLLIASCWTWPRHACRAWNGNDESQYVSSHCSTISLALIFSPRIVGGAQSFARPPMPFAPPGMPGMPPGFAPPPGFGRGGPPPGFGGPPPG